MVYKFSYLAAFLILGSLWTSCYEPPDGCRDPKAENYEVSADKDCENDCCKYADLVLAVDHTYNDIELDTNTIIPHPESGDIRIRSLIFYASDFKMHNGKFNDVGRIIERISVGYDINGTTEFESKIFPVAKIKLGKSDNYILGSFKNADLYQSISFDFGIKDSINYADLSQIPFTNPLYQNVDSMYINRTQGFYFLKIIFEYEGNKEKTIQINGSASLLSNTFEHEFDFQERSDRVLDCIIDYEKWLKNIDLTDDTDETIKGKLIQNLSDSFIFR